MTPAQIVETLIDPDARLAYAILHSLQTLGDPFVGIAVRILDAAQRTYQHRDPWKTSDLEDD